MLRSLDLNHNPEAENEGAGVADSFLILVRHFFGRFFDKESLSPQGESEASLYQILGFLAVPSAFFVLVFRPLTLMHWELVAVRYFFLSLSMVLMGFLMVFEWDVLFPDRRDYQILMPLPLRLYKVFLAKVTALAIFLGIFLVDINFFGVLLWPGIDAGDDLVRIWLTHIAAMVLGGLFAALSMGAVQGVLMTFLGGNLLRRVSIFLQTVLMAALVMLLFLTPVIGFGIKPLAKAGNDWLYWFPGFWFVGVYEQMRPATHHPMLLAAGNIGWRALGIVALVFLVTYLPAYRRHARRVLEAPEPSPSGPGRLRSAISGAIDRFVLRHPLQIAVFHFITGTITRSMKHRLFLATYGGIGAALGVMTLVADRSGLLQLPLTLSFILISGLRAAFNFPSELRANWAFQVSEGKHTVQYLIAMRKWICLAAITPLFALLAPVEFLNFGWTEALFHLAYGVTLSLALMEIMFFGFSKIPFTCSYFPAKLNLTGLAAIYIFGFTMYSRTMASFEVWLLGHPAAAVAFFIVVPGALAFLRENLQASLQYEDAVDPAVRTLDLAVH